LYLDELAESLEDKYEIIEDNSSDYLVIRFSGRFYEYELTIWDREDNNCFSFSTMIYKLREIDLNKLDVIYELFNEFNSSMQIGVVSKNYDEIQLEYRIYTDDTDIGVTSFNRTIETLLVNCDLIYSRVMRILWE
jgi:hypothetical protein